MNIDDTAAAAQRQRLLEALKRGPVTTLEARESLNVYHPAARVLELRDAGNRIVTAWVTAPDAWGRPHRVARYVLTRSARTGRRRTGRSVSP